LILILMTTKKKYHHVFADLTSLIKMFSSKLKIFW